MPPALSADPISPSTIERPLRPPIQRSLTRGDTDAHWFSLESLIAALAGLVELNDVDILRRDYEVWAVVGLVVDPATADADPPRAYLGLFLFLSSPRFARRRWPAPKARLRASTSFESSLISP
jgi:hypothetical protein